MLPAIQTSLGERRGEVRALKTASDSRKNAPRKLCRGHRPIGNVPRECNFERYQARPYYPSVGLGIAMANLSNQNLERARLSCRRCGPSIRSSAKLEHACGPSLSHSRDVRHWIVLLYHRTPPSLGPSHSTTPLPLQLCILQETKEHGPAASCQFLSVDLAGDHNNSRHLITREFGMAAPFREVVAPSPSFPLWRTGWTGGSKPGPKWFASSRSGALGFLRPVCFNIVQKNLGDWASGMRKL